MLKLSFPNFIAHYNRGELFRSITRAPQDQWQNIIENLNLSRFTDPAYLKQRVQAELQVRNTFIAKGGQPKLKQPIYFFLVVINVLKSIS